MGIETIFLVVGVIIAVTVTVLVAKSRRKLGADLDGAGDGDPRVKPPAAPARPPRQ